MRIIRASIYLGLVALLMPSPPPSEVSSPLSPVSHTASVEPPDMFMAAVGAVDDLSHFCARQPTVCETAHAVIAKLEAKAKYSIRLVYEWAQAPAVPAQDPPLGVRAKADPLITGSITLVAAATYSQSTLTIEDIIPEWKGPKERKPG